MRVYDVKLKMSKDAAIEVNREELSLRIGENIFSEQRTNKNSNTYDLLAILAKRLTQADIELQCCGACKNFRFSGMSMQMSNGFTGYCGLVGFRNPSASVNIDHYCDKFVQVEGWPNDLDLVFKNRVG